VKRSALMQLMTTLTNADTVITLNWDVLVERCLTLIRKTWKYYRDNNSVAILKLHGSINWFKYKNAVYGTSRIYPGANAFHGLCSFDQVPAITLKALDNCILVPPTPTKDIGDINLKRIWNQAYLTLQRAESIYCIGYSMPENDDLVRLLLKRAFFNNLIMKANGTVKFTLINPDDSANARFKRLVVGNSKGYVYYPLTFEQAVYSGRLK